MCAKVFLVILRKAKRKSDERPNLARTNKLNALPDDILASEEVFTLLVERQMRFFSIRGGRFKPGSIPCDLFAGPKNLGFEDGRGGSPRNSAYIDKVSSA